MERSAEGSMNAAGDATPTFRIGGVLEVRRLGFGAMRLTGPGLWGEPADPGEARRVLERAVELGVGLIDTADSYGPHVSERLIGEALGGAGRAVIATKAGFVRPSPDRFEPCGDPAHLRRSAEESRERLRVEAIDLWQLHCIDPTRPAGLQFEAVARMLQDGLIRHAGLCNVTVAQIEAAQAHFAVATVQNRYNLIDREHEAVLDWCEAHGVGFIPWYPLASGLFAGANSPLGAVAERLNATPAQVALAWLLRRSPVMLPIPGTSHVAHLEENLAAAALALPDKAFEALDARGREAWAARCQGR
ncbi:MAG: aldo/keto reductase [Proteobacteria bacterium]|nr:aldo/keto reductase [Pseudomonadota bacterium]